MSIQSQITRIKNAKNDILSTLEEKGVIVPSGVLLDDVANLIRQISTSNNYLTSELDNDLTDVNLSIEFEGETTDGTNPAYYLVLNFN